MILSEFKGLHLPLEAIEGLAADFWLEKAVPYSDGVWEEGPLIVKSSSIGYQKTHVKAGMAKQRKEPPFRERKVPFAKGRFVYERKIFVGPN